MRKGKAHARLDFLSRVFVPPCLKDQRIQGKMTTSLVPAQALRATAMVGSKIQILNEPRNPLAA